MAKIGRNEKCPCRSGKKYKHCCARRAPQTIQALSAEESAKITLMQEVRRIQEDAVNKRLACRELGVFFFFSSSAGDAWLMEMTDSDCVQVAANGQALDTPIEENAETIEVNWSHSYRIQNKNLELRSYTDKTVRHLDNAPTKELNAATRRLLKKLTPEQVKSVHLKDKSEADSSVDL
ncbi:MAG: preprotein translocase subunit SecA [Deltaproteobacteria bacterium]|nr:MAG: preprotein translocase subunit SecA [Deltaproteobacteria bacterium]